jgi:hypothetical protein
MLLATPSPSRGRGLVPSLSLALALGLALGDGATALASNAIAFASESSAKAQLDNARQMRRAATKKSGEERRAALAAAAVAYREVLTQNAGNPAAGATCAEAAFRAGEIERSLGDLEGATSAFEAAVKHGKDAPQFGARGLSELGHLARRKQEWDVAIGFYQRVDKEYPGQTAEGARAATWIGKIEDRLCRHEDARKTWLAIGDRFPSQPILAIRAVDLAALDAIEQGDPAAGKQMIEDAAKRYGFENKDQDWWTPEVDDALNRMKAREKLGLASAKAGADASDEDDEEGGEG